MIAGLLLAAVSAVAAQGAARPATAAQLYSYEVEAERFDPAYRAHLDWHRAAKDHLVWYGWTVAGGASPGRFVDGTFGSSLADIDRRPNPAEDGKHFATNVAAYAKPLATTTWQLWPEVSTAFLLEDRTPSAMVDVLTVEVLPGASARFEAALHALADRRGQDAKLGWTWYRAQVGQRLPSYLVMIPRRNWADLEGRGQSISAIAGAALGVAPSDAAALDAMVERISSEVWRYRADLSYFPGK